MATQQMCGEVTKSKQAYKEIWNSFPNIEIGTPSKKYWYFDSRSWSRVEGRKHPLKTISTKWQTYWLNYFFSTKYHYYFLPQIFLPSCVDSACLTFGQWRFFPSFLLWSIFVKNRIIILNYFCDVFLSVSTTASPLLCYAFWLLFFTSSLICRLYLWETVIIYLYYSCYKCAEISIVCYISNKIYSCYYIAYSTMSCSIRLPIYENLFFCVASVGKSYHTNHHGGVRGNRMEGAYAWNFSFWEEPFFCIVYYC